MYQAVLVVLTIVIAINSNQLNLFGISEISHAIKSIHHEKGVTELCHGTILILIEIVRIVFRSILRNPNFDCCHTMFEK